MAAPVLQFKRGAFSNLPALKAGEPGFTTDKYDFYIGLDNNSANNKFFGSHRYWKKETTSTGSGINLVEGSSTGDSYITLSSPDSLVGIVTYYLPGSQGVSDSVLTNDGNGNLTWGSGSANPVFTGIATFNTTQVNINSTLEVTGVSTFSDTTDNTLGDPDTGAVQIDGGLGINKNVTVGAAASIVGNLYVGGQSEFIGIVTFRGGTINLGDSGNDDVVIGGEFASDLIPTTDDVYSLGSLSKQWKDLYINGTVDTDSLTVSGVSTFAGNIDANGGLNVVGGSTLDQLNVSGVSTFVGVSTFQNNVFIDGSLTVAGVSIDGGVSIGEDITTRNISVTGLSTFSGVAVFLDSITGTASTSTRATTVDTTSTSTNADFFVPFVDTFAGQNGETVRVGAGLSLNPSTGDVKIAGDLQINGNDIKSSDGNTNITLTSNTLTTFAGDVKVGGNDIQASDGTTAITLSGANITVAGDVTVGGNDIKASDGTTAITLTPTTGAVGVASDLTVSGSLYVLGSTTEVNTETLKVEDSLIEIGLVNSGGSLVPPPSDLNIDVGILFHYYTSSAKKAGIYWDDSVSRVVIGSDLTESSSVITSSAYADLEIGSLWVTDCAGTSQVISCSGSERFLENITVDGGSF